MATLQSVFIPALTNPVKIAALGATTASSVQTFAKYSIIAVTASGDVQITFCNAANPPTISTAVGWLIHSGETAEFELGSQWDSCIIYNPGASTVDVYILPLSRS